MESLDPLRLVIGAGFLLYATVLDLKTRRVHNGVWIALATCGGLLFAIDWLDIGRLDWLHLLVAALIVALAYALWYLHILAGGADAKALMALAILLPAPIDWSFLGTDLPAWASPLPLPGSLVALPNSVLLFALAPVLLFLLNASRGRFRWPAMLLGYPMDLDRAQTSFVWIMDLVRPDGTLGQAVFPTRMSDEDYEANVRLLREHGIQRVWVTPKIPFMLPLLLGFLAAFTVGDVLGQLVLRLVTGSV